jgi:hypothetical protein
MLVDSPGEHLIPLLAEVLKFEICLLIVFFIRRVKEGLHQSCKRGEVGGQVDDGHSKHSRNKNKINPQKKK